MAALTVLEDAAVAYVTARLVAEDVTNGPSIEEVLAVETSWHELLMAAGRCTCEVET